MSHERRGRKQQQHLYLFLLKNVFLLISFWK
jgi:hypothetical protein